MPKTFANVQAFFKSWGIYPSEEDTDDHNSEVIEQGINRACFNQMCAQAKERHGYNFASFVSSAIDANDDAFYCRYETWTKLESRWIGQGCPGKF